MGYLTLVSFQLEYFDPDGTDAFELKYLVGSSLKQGDLNILNVHTRSISVQEIYPGEFSFLA